MAGKMVDVNYRKIDLCVGALQNRDVNSSLAAAKDIVDPNVLHLDKSGEGVHVLYQAVRTNHHPVVEILLEKGANVNFQDEEGETPLFAALDIEIDGRIQSLLYDYGADVDIANKAGNTALMDMAIRGFDFGHKFTDVTLFNLLTRCKFFNQLNSREQSLMHLVPFVHNIEILENYNDHICVKFLKLLIDNGLCVNTPDSTGLTPLHYACFACCQEAVKFLVDKGADMTSKSISGETILHALGSSPSGTDFKAIFEYLTGKGLDAMNTDMFGRNVLHYAASSNKVNKKAVEIILAHSDIVNTKDKFGLTALHVCVIPSVFISADHIEDDEDMKNDVSEVITLLCQHGAIVDAVDNNQLTPMHYVVHYEKKIPTIEALLRHGADVTKRTKTGESVIHRATMYPGVLQCILDYVDEKDKHIDINVTDNFGCTPLQWAVYFKSADCISILLEAGADRNIVGSNGLNACEYAISSKATNLFDVLDISNVQQTHPLPYKITEDDLLMDESYCMRTFNKTKEMIAEEREAMEMGLNEIPKNDDGQSRTEAMDPGCVIIKASGKEVIFKVLRDKNYHSENWTWLKSDNVVANMDVNKSVPISATSADSFTATQTFVGPNDSESDSECTEEKYFDCSKVDHMWFGCPVLSEVDCVDDAVFINDWTSRLPCHRRSLAAYINHILDAKQMGMWTDTGENNVIADNVNRLLNLLALEMKRNNSLFEFTLQLTGSWNEGTKVGLPNEFDYKLILLKFYNAVEPCESDNPDLRGFVRLKIKNGHHNEDFRKYLTDDGYIDGRKVVRALYASINSALMSIPLEEMGQLYSMKYLKIDKSSIDHLSFRWVGPLYKNLLIDIDIVPAIILKSWNSSFLNTSKRLYHVNGPSSVVLKTHNSRYVKEWYTFFRLSVSDHETEIFRSLPNEILKGYILVKALLESLLFPQIRMYGKGEYLRTQSLTTYILKSSFLHQVEKHGTSDQAVLDSSNPTDLRQVSLKMAKQIIDYLEFVMTDVLYLESFFIPGVNLLANESLTRFNNSKFFSSEVTCLSLLLEIGTDELQNQFPFKATFETKRQRIAEEYGINRIV